jgi:hypothetical protein
VLVTGIDFANWAVGRGMSVSLRSVVPLYRKYIAETTFEAIAETKIIETVNFSLNGKPTDWPRTNQ